MSRKLAATAFALALTALMPLAVSARADHAVLIRVDVIREAAKPGSGAANCSNDGPTGSAYELTGWTVAAAGTTAHLNTATIPGSLTGDVVGALQASFNAWGNLAGVPDIAVATDGTLTRQASNHQYDLLWGRTSGGSIAVTYTWRWSDGEIESDTVFNKSLSWYVAGTVADGCDETTAKYDVANIATHEFGHTYGLGHAAGDRFETMYPYGYTGETLKRTPGNGDLAGINFLY